MFKDIVFADPMAFWLLLLVPLAILWYCIWNKKSKPKLVVSSTASFSGKKSMWAYLPHLPFLLKMLALVALVVALARPQTRSDSAKVKVTEGIDIVMAMDVSSSMLAKDLKPNRLESLKRVASTFIKNRTSDRIGLVVYSGESYTKIPVTTDKSIILRGLDEITYGQVEDGTAIGMGLATAVNRLKESKAKSRVIILLTDGVNNSGFIDPQTAAELAAEYGIKVYTIGIGTNGMALSPVAINPDGSFVYQNTPVQIDEKLMKNIAQITGGTYFRATDEKKLEQIYQEIDKLETTEIEEFKYTHIEEKFRFWALLGAVLLLADFLLRHTVFRSYM